MRQSTTFFAGSGLTVSPTRHSPWRGAPPGSAPTTATLDGELPDGESNTYAQVRYTYLRPRTFAAESEVGYAFMGWDGDPAIAGSTESPMTADLPAEAAVSARFVPCGQETTVAVIDSNNTVANKPGLVPYGWNRLAGSAAPLVFAEDAQGQRYLTSNGVVTTGAWIQRLQSHPDTEITFSYRFGANARADQSLHISPRYTDDSHRVGLRILQDRFQLVNVDPSVGDPHLIIAQQYSTPGMWHEVYVRTVGTEILVWVRSEDSPFTLEQAVTFTPPLDFRDETTLETRVDTVAHTGNAEIRVGMVTPANTTMAPGAIQFRDLTVSTLACGGMEPIEYTPCADVIISEIYPNVPGEPICYTDENSDNICLDTPWIELWNRSSELVDLEGWSLTDNMEFSPAYIFPPGSTIGAGMRMVLGLPSDSENLEYKDVELNASGGFLALACGAEVTKSLGANGTAAQALLYGGIESGESYQLVSGDPIQYFQTPQYTPGTPYILIPQPIRLTFEKHASIIVIPDAWLHASLKDTEPNVFFDYQLVSEWLNTMCDRVSGRRQFYGQNQEVFPGQVLCPADIAPKPFSLYQDIKDGFQFTEGRAGIDSRGVLFGPRALWQAAKDAHADVLVVRLLANYLPGDYLAVPGRTIMFDELGADDINDWESVPPEKRWRRIIIGVDTFDFHPVVLLHEIGHFLGILGHPEPTEKWKMLGYVMAAGSYKKNDRNPDVITDRNGNLLLWRISEWESPYFLGLWNRTWPQNPTVLHPLDGATD